MGTDESMTPLITNGMFRLNVYKFVEPPFAVTVIGPVTILPNEENTLNFAESCRVCTNEGRANVQAAGANT
jgi:hypothetical protein